MRHGRFTSRTLIVPVVVGLGMLVSAAAWAGEIKFGEGSSSLAVDDEGKLTPEGAKTAIKEIDKLPGEDLWDLKIWMKLDKPKPAEGPLYIEFYQSVDGQEHIVHRHEIAADGETKYFSDSVELEGKQGFNKNRSYRVQVIQNDGKRDIKLAESSIKLINTGRKPPESEEGDTEDTDGEDAEQDALDTLDGPEEPTDAVPPTTESPTKKKGCSVASDAELGFSGVLLLALCGIGLARSRRRAA